MMRLETEDALRLMEGGDLLAVGSEADAMRRQLHPENVVTYAVSAPPGLSLQDAAQDAAQHGDHDVLLPRITQDPSHSVDTLLRLLETQRRDSPDVRFHHLSVNLLRGANTLPLARLQDAGVRSLLLEISPASPLPDAGAFLLAGRAADIDTDVVFTMGKGEPLAARIDTLCSLRALHEETGAIRALSVQVHHSVAPDARREEDATAVDYLKTLAVTRLLLDTVEHLQADWSVMGPKVLELALRFGANDAGSVARSQKGPEPSHHGGESELRRIIRDAGFRPVERDVSFRLSTLR